MNLKQTAGALLVMVAAGLASAAAQTAGITEPSTALRLTPEQRAEIYQAVGNNKLRTPPPPDLPVQVLCEDQSGTYELPFACSFSNGAWRNHESGGTLEATVIAWRRLARRG